MSELSIAHILDSAQLTVNNHDRCLNKLENMISDGGKDLLLKEFIPLVKRALIHKKGVHAERVIRFIIEFSSKSTIIIDSKHLSVFIIEILLPFTRLSRGTKEEKISKSIRYRSTQIIGGILNNIDIDIEENLWFEIESALIERTRDKDASIRIEAIKALAPLQDALDADNIVIQEYLRLLRTDPNKDVRKHVLLNIDFSKYTLQPFLERIRDISPEVRKTCYIIIGQQLDIKALSIAQRLELIKCGLIDTDESVRYECLQMCIQWLESRNSNLIELLNHLDVENSDEIIIETLLRYLLNHVILSPKDISWKENITSELAILWRVFCDHLHDINTQDSLNKLEHALPEETMTFCKILKYNIEKENTFIVKQLLGMCKYLDVSDVATSKVLAALIKSSLTLFYEEE